jgi:hypothetical protein
MAHHTKRRNSAAAVNAETSPQLEPVDLGDTASSKSGLTGLTAQPASPADPSPGAMIFNIGPFPYRVLRRRNLRAHGERLDGFCASSARCLWLDADLDDIAIVSTLRHEHAHAWAIEVSHPHSSEDVACFTAAVGTAFDMDFTAQGGLAKLRALPIDGARPTQREAGAR